MKGAFLHDLGSVLLLGIPLQLIVAVGALLVTALHGAGRELGSLLSGPTVRRTTPAQPSCAASLSSAPPARAACDHEDPRSSELTMSRLRSQPIMG